jgi:hypothetical protein
LLTNGDSGEPSQVEGYPMRAWSIEIFLLDENGQEVTANCFEKATYNLHPSFEKNKQGTLTARDVGSGTWWLLYDTLRGRSRRSTSERLS